MVTVNHICKSRHQNTKFCLWFAQFGTDKKRDRIIIFTTTDPHDISTGRQFRRYHKTEIRFPIEVIYFILMKRNCSIMFRLVAPIHFTGIPKRACHRPCWRMYQLQIRTVLRCAVTRNRHSRNVLRKIPSGYYVAISTNARRFDFAVKTIVGLTICQGGGNHHHILLV